MKYALCPYSSTDCGTSQQTLSPLIDVRQVHSTGFMQFNKGEYCVWQIYPAQEFYFNLELKVQIEEMQSTECFLNVGGSVFDAGQEETCYAGKEYTFDLGALGSQNLYMVVLANDNLSNIRFAYWAQYKYSSFEVVTALSIVGLIIALVFICMFVCIMNMILASVVGKEEKQIKINMADAMDKNDYY